MSKPDASQNIQQFKTWFDTEFEKYLASSLKKVQKKYNVAEVNKLLEYIPTLATSGKRLRPYLTHCSYTAYGGKKDISGYLFGIELLHIFALIHDDIMDEAVIRHGKPTAHIEYKKYFAAKSTHTALSQAILVGDLVFSLAEESFHNPETMISNKNSHRAYGEYRTLVHEVIYGQMLDIFMTSTPPTSLKDIYKKMALKSGNYSIMRPLLIGAALAGAKENDIQFLQKYGESVGVAFQIQDDLLDCNLNQKNIGKTVFADIQSSQQTYISFFMLTRAAPAARSEFLKYFGRVKKYSAKEEIVITELLESSGAISFTTKEIEKHFKLAYSAISKYNQKNPELWTNILQILQSREK